MSDFIAEKILAPADRRMLETFARIPTLAKAIEAVSRERYETHFHLAVLASGAQVEENDFPQMFANCREISARFALEMPEIFVCSGASDIFGSAIGARIIGANPPRLLISGAAIKNLSAAQLRILLAQTLAHIPCGHFPYLVAKDLLAAAADNLGLFKAPATVSRALFAEWQCAADLSCDRAALWATEDFSSVLDYFCAAATATEIISGGGKQVTHEHLLAQGQKFLAAQRSASSCSLFSAWSNLYLAMPRWGLRAVELKKWADSAEYAEMRGKISAEKAGKNADEPAYWGAFAGDWRDWEDALNVGGESRFDYSSATGATDNADTNNFFGGGFDRATDGRRENFAMLAEIAARSALSAASRVTDFFFTAIKK